RDLGGPDDVRHDLGLRVESAYLQRGGQFALRVDYDYFQGNYLNGLASKGIFNHEHTLTLGAQIGILDGLQLGLGVPFTRHVTNVKGAANKIISPAGEILDLGGQEEDLDDLSLGLRLGLLSQTSDNPQVTGGLDFTAPIGDDTEYIGRDRSTYTPALLVSKEFASFILHSNLRYRFTPSAQNRLLHRQVDRKEVEMGMGLDFPLSESVHLANEVQARWEDFGVKRTGITFTKFGDFANGVAFWVPGIKIYSGEAFKIASGLSLGLTEDSPKLGFSSEMELSF
ncbi:MAG: hypothetical protein HY722_15145, partial [Planctomycetes bacterium]|nr:hypothetical protein [Planctomycetota bacterium]